MDKQKAKILYDLLKSSSTDKICRGLREIKKRMLTNFENISVFRSLGLIPQTLKLIQRPNEEILNGALSTLSICCTDEDVRREVFSKGGVTHMVNVLKCAKLEPLQMRACRTLANQAQHKPSCEMLVRLRAVELVIEVLDGCQEEETKVAGIRALRLFANCGEHCQKIVTCQGILRICSAGFGLAASTAGPNLMRATVKAIAHFSRISHPACITQIMEGTDNMILMSKIWDSSDLEIYECVLRTILNTVHSCFVPTPHKRDALDAKVLDRLCTATAPSIIVEELQNRRVTTIEEGKLVLALCKFCEGSSECNNLTFGSFSEPPTFLGRAWMQLIDCGGVAMLVTLLTTYRTHHRLRPALLRAILGVEHNYSYRDKILKHLLAAKLLPLLAEQFDELMNKYLEVRRTPLPGKCIHTITSLNTDEDETAQGGGSNSNSSKEETEKGGTGKEMEIEQKDLNSQVNKMEIEEDKKQGKEKQGETLPQGDNKAYNTNKSPLIPPLQPPPKDTRPASKYFYSGGSHSNSSSGSPESSSNPRSPTRTTYLNPTSPNSVSCSSRSYQSSSESPSWSPPVARSESPTISSPPFVGGIHTSPLFTSLPPWSVEAAHISPTASPPHSPPTRSPLRSTSPIRDPSDWEYEDEEEEAKDDGRFSPTVLESKLNELEESQEELEEEEEEESMSVEEEIEGTPLETPKEVVSVSDENIQEEEAPFSPNAGKRGRDSPTIAITPQEKKVKLDEEETEGVNPSSSRSSPPLREAVRSEVEIVGQDSKSPFVNLNQIKFRVGKKGHTRRQLSMREVYTPLQEPPMTEIKPERKQKQQEQKEQKPPSKPGRRGSERCSSSMYSDLTPEEAQCLALLELVVRVIGQVAHVKEAIKPVCREFVPRIVTYLCKVQVIHTSATRLLVTIARCPKLLHDFMVCYPTIDLLMSVLHSSQPPDQASYMYATAALSRLASTLQLENQYKPVRCEVCYRRESHTKEEVTAQLETKNIRQAQTQASPTHTHPPAHTVTHTPVHTATRTGAHTATPTSFKIETKDCQWLKDEEEQDVTFKLKDGSTVSANREFLADKNEFLNGMLMGSFSEGQCSSVELPWTSKESVEMLIHYLHGCWVCAHMEGRAMEAYMELVLMSQMYLVERLQLYAETQMISAINKWNDIIQIYESGVGRINENLVLRAICTVLVKPMKTWKRARWIKGLFQSPHAEDIDHNIRMILHHPLDMNRLVCNCNKSLSLYMVSESEYTKLC